MVQDVETQGLLLGTFLIVLLYFSDYEPDLIKALAIALAITFLRQVPDIILIKTGIHGKFSIQDKMPWVFVGPLLFSLISDLQGFTIVLCFLSLIEKKLKTNQVNDGNKARISPEDKSKFEKKKKSNNIKHELMKIEEELKAI